jgi:hypothetical protein
MAALVAAAQRINGSPRLAAVCEPLRTERVNARLNDGVRPVLRDPSCVSAAWVIAGLERARAGLWRWGRFEPTRVHGTPRGQSSGAGKMNITR